MSEPQCLPGGAHCNPADVHPAAKSFTSSDGRVLPFTSVGRGPGIVVFHGSMQSALSNLGLAAHLASRFTVHLPTRRSEVLGVPFDRAYCMQAEVDDLLALLAYTGSSFVFGISSGALVCLEAALQSRAIQRVALFEPALIVDDDLDMSHFDRCDAALLEGNDAAALVAGMKAVRLAPALVNCLPDGLLELLTRRAIAAEERQPSGAPSMRQMAASLHYDFALLREAANKVARYDGVRTEALLLGGSKSPAWLKRAVTSLASVLPRHRRFQFEGLAHGACGDDSATNRGGHPERVAPTLATFFS